MDEERVATGAGPDLRAEIRRIRDPLGVEQLGHLIGIEVAEELDGVLVRPVDVLDHPDRRCLDESCHPRGQVPEQDGPV